MAQKKYVTLSRLSNFLDNIKIRYSKVGHKHTTSDITDFPDVLTYTLSKSGSEIILTDSNGDTTSVTDSDTKTTVDSALSSTSTNPVQNKIINSALSEKVSVSRTINGKQLSSDIVLGASDVGADTSGSANTALISAKAHTDEQITNMVGSSSVGTQISSHNTATDCHSDIRSLISDLTTRLNTLADSDDTTLDQLSEIVTYIKSNRNLIEEVTTNKVSVSDIIDNLTTSDSTKVLSAKQGVAIQSLINTLQDSLNTHTHNYAGSSSAGGAATSANKLNTDAGSSTQPIYFNGGKPVATTYSLNKTVPSNAVFTDTTYDVATSTENGLMSVLDKAKVDSLAPVTTGGTGDAYTATVSGITELTAGVNFVMIPNVVSTSTTPTLNVNGLGAKTIKRRLSSLSTSLQDGYSNSWLAKGKPFRVMYDGTYWVVEGLTKPVAADMYGLTASVTELNYTDGVTSNIQTQLDGKASSSHTHSASNVTAGTLAGSVVANASAVSTLTTKQVRNTTISTADPTSSDGGNGDIWITYGSTQSDCPFPVGGIYISVASTSPSTLWTGTTWEQFATGKTLVGFDSSDSDFSVVGQTGGEKTHTLTTDEMPAHTHGMAHTHTTKVPASTSTKYGTNSGGQSPKATSTSYTSGTSSITVTGSTGGGSAHNNLQPYITVYMWKRVS